MKQCFLTILPIVLWLSGYSQIDNDHLSIDPASVYYGARISFYRIDNQVEISLSYNNAPFHVIYTSPLIANDPPLNINYVLLLRTDAQGTYKYQVKIINEPATNIFNPWNLVATVNLTGYDGNVINQGADKDHVMHINTNSGGRSRPGEVTTLYFTISKNWSTNN